jgi:TPP-dependent pyruvate/acetoin dehydrogenase alpha subunit
VNIANITNRANSLPTAAAERVRLDVCTRTSSLAEQYALLTGIRQFEQSLLDLFATGVLVGTTHTCVGQETVAVGVISAIDRERDIVFSNHRGHGHFLAYCGEVERLYLEVMGKAGGVCGGRGGSQHLQFRNFYSNGVQGGIVPVATGMALAEKLKRTGAIAVVFLGDGTLGEGVVYEAFNIAALWQLPIVFVIEHNGYAQSTPSARQIAGAVAARPQAFAIPTTECSAAELTEVLGCASRAVDAARAGAGPQCLVCYTYRLAPHSKGDDDRPSEELTTAWARDPLKAARTAVADDKVTVALEGMAEERVRIARLRALEPSALDR